MREVLALIERPTRGPGATVLGMVADFLTVQREYAPLIDLALGERAQRFLVRDAGAVDTTLCASAASRSPAGSVSPL